MATDEFEFDLTALDSDSEEQKGASSTPAAAEAPSGKTPQRYRASDSHRETLKLLANLSPAAVTVPTSEEVKDALHDLLTGDEVPDLDDVDEIQRLLEEKLDAPLEARRQLIESEVEAQVQAQRRFKDMDVSQSQKSEATDATGDAKDGEAGKKRRRTGGRAGFAAQLPLMLPKATGKTKSILVQVDDQRQHLEGDSGAVGRVHNDGKELILDIKGHQYKGHLVRSSALLLVSMGDGEAKVEEIFENLCVLTHHHDHFQHLSGQIVKGSGHQESDYESGSDIETSKTPGKKRQKSTGGGGGGKSASVKKSAGKPASKPRAKPKAGAKKSPKKGAKGATKKKAGPKGASAKKGPRKVSLGELKKANKGRDEDDSEPSEDEPDDDDDSDFSG